MLSLRLSAMRAVAITKIWRWLFGFAFLGTLHGFDDAAATEKAAGTDAAKLAAFCEKATDYGTDACGCFSGRIEDQAEASDRNARSESLSFSTSYYLWASDALTLDCTARQAAGSQSLQDWRDGAKACFEIRADVLTDTHEDWLERHQFLSGNAAFAAMFLTEAFRCLPRSAKERDEFATRYAAAQRELRASSPLIKPFADTAREICIGCHVDGLKIETSPNATSPTED